MIIPLIYVDRILNLIALEGLKVGLVLNIGKCEIWSPNLNDQLEANVDNPILS